jgi:hypothetical protein
MLRAVSSPSNSSIGLILRLFWPAVLLLSAALLFVVTRRWRHLSAVDLDDGLGEAVRVCELPGRWSEGKEATELAEFIRSATGLRLTKHEETQEASKPRIPRTVI